MGNVSATRRKHFSKDLEKYCKPTGLYETCPWEERVVRRWILEGDVAPRYPGSDAPGYVNSGNSLSNVVEGVGAIGHGSTVRVGSGDSSSGRGGGGMDMGASGRAITTDNHGVHSESRQKQVIHTEECPICFMHYQGVNRTVCCSKPLCTECYLQVRPPRTSVVCPFCNCSKFSVEYLGPPSKEDSERLLAEEQRTIEARIRAEREAILRQMEEREKRENAAAETTASGAGGAGAFSTSPTTTSADASAGGVSARAAFPPAPKVVLSTVAERRLTEMQIRNQHVRQPRDITRRSVPRRGTRSVHRQASVDSDGSNDFQNQSDVRGESSLEGEIQQVEDLMLMEALRLSVLEEQARRERSGDMRRAASAAAVAAASASGWGGGASNRRGVTGETSSSSLGARLSPTYWDRLITPVAAAPSSASSISASTSASSSAAALTVATASTSVAEPAPSISTAASVSASVAPSSSNPGNDRLDFLSEGGLSRWVDVRRIQADLIDSRRGSGGTTGDGNNNGGGGRGNGTGTGTGNAASRATEGASEPGEPQSAETFMQSLRATLERSPTARETDTFVSASSAASGPYARAAGAAAPEHTSMHTSLSTSGVEDPIGSIIRSIRQDARLGRAPDRTASTRGAGNQRSGFLSGSAGSMQRGRGRLRSEVFGAAAGAAATGAAAESYLPELPESEDEQLMLAIALSLRTSGAEKRGTGAEVGGGDGLDARDKVEFESFMTSANASSPLELFRSNRGGSGASGKEARGEDEQARISKEILRKFETERVPYMAERGQEEKRSENTAGASAAAPAFRSEEGHGEEVVRKLSAPASEESSANKSPDPDPRKGAGAGATGGDSFEAAAEAFATYAAAATGRGHSEAWSPSQQRRSARFPFPPVSSLEEEKEVESKAARVDDNDLGGSRLRWVEEPELSTVLEAGAGDEATDGEPLVESESMPAETGNDCGVSSRSGGGIVDRTPSGNPSGGTIGGDASSLPTDTDSPASTSEGTNTASSNLIGGSGGGGPMSVDATVAVGEASNGGSSMPSSGLVTDDVVDSEGEVTAAVEEEGETRAVGVSEEVEGTEDASGSSA